MSSGRGGAPASYYRRSYRKPGSLRETAVWEQVQGSPVENSNNDDEAKRAGLCAGKNAHRAGKNPVEAGKVAARAARAAGGSPACITAVSAAAETAAAALSALNRMKLDPRLTPRQPQSQSGDEPATSKLYRRRHLLQRLRVAEVREQAQSKILATLSNKLLPTALEWVVQMVAQDVGVEKSGDIESITRHLIAEQLEAYYSICDLEEAEQHNARTAAAEVEITESVRKARRKREQMEHAFESR